MKMVRNSLTKVKSTVVRNSITEFLQFLKNIKIKKIFAVIQFLIYTFD